MKKIKRIPNKNPRMQEAIAFLRLRNGFNYKEAKSNYVHIREQLFNRRLPSEFAFEYKIKKDELSEVANMFVAIEEIQNFWWL